MFSCHVFETNRFVSIELTLETNLSYIISTTLLIKRYNNFFTLKITSNICSLYFWLFWPQNLPTSLEYTQQTFALMKTSWRRLSSSSSEDVLVKTNIFVLAIRLQDVFKTFSRRLQDVLQKRLQDIFKTSSRRFQDVFKTSSRRLAKVSSRRFQDVSSSYAVLVNKFSRCLQDVFTTFLRRTAKTVIYTEGFPLVILVRNYGQCTKFVRVATVSKVLVFHFSTHFSGCLQRCI